MNSPTSRAERPRLWRRFYFTFTVIVTQLLIAVVAFGLVRDYMDDGYITHAVTNVLNQVAGEGTESNTDQDLTIAVKPSAELGEAANQEIAAVQKTLTTIEPVETPPAETQEQVISAPSPPKAEVRVTAPAVEPEPLPQAVGPVASAIEPEAAPKAAEHVVAVAPIPDLTPLKDALVAPAPSESTSPQQTDGQAFRDCATCPELVVINAGRFAMGEGSEGLEHQGVTATQDVAIAAPFAIGRYEITFDEWSQCVGDGSCTGQPADENWGRGRHPVINVSFNDITQQYLPWLSGKTGFTYRLPTEAEWEFAARGGAAAPAGQAYSFGDDGTLLCQYGNSSDGTGGTCSDGFATTAPAGSLKANALGLFDMHGNVWEWMGDCWQPQFSAKAAKPLETCVARVLRGGSWASNATALRSAARGWEKQNKSKNSIGFRVARQQP